MRQPWLVNPAFDTLWILGPAFLSSLLVLFIPAVGGAVRQVSPIQWFLLVVCIDVAHVYSTTYRTYFDSEERARYRTLLLGLPIIAWVIGAILYSISSALFWSALAYVAVFHFVRQQYGFMALYRRNDRPEGRMIDCIAVYMATIYPLIYWHAHLPRGFNWFVDGDFVFAIPSYVSEAAGWLYVCCMTAFVVQEANNFWEKRAVNIPKVGIIIGTALAWYVGIVHFNADLPFTLTNVISHGVPYMALVWAYQSRKESKAGSSIKPHRAFFTPKMLPVYLGILILFAFLEEGLWDAMVWRDHRTLFGEFWGIPKIRDLSLLALIVPLLSVPQTTHYLIDAFIWRLRKPNSEMVEFLPEGTEI